MEKEARHAAQLYENNSLLVGGERRAGEGKSRHFPSQIRIIALCYRDLQTTLSKTQKHRRQMLYRTQVYFACRLLCSLHQVHEGNLPEEENT
jgi:hypothetical protein